MLTHVDFRKKWKEYMEKSGHVLVPNMPLPSYSDPTLLFVNSGMFPLVPYLEGQAHPQGNKLYNIQRCIRPMEFDEIGDNRHTSVFEMIGNWSLNDYFKKEQLRQWYTFLIEELKLDPSRLYASVFVGDKNAPRDTESIEILQEIFKKYGISAKVASDNVEGTEEIDLSEFRIFPYSKKNNWWQRGDTIGELGGPDSETFYDLQIQHDSKKWGFVHPATDSGRFIEIGNSVFMQYKKNEKGWEPLKQKNVDFGGGLERIMMVVQNKTDIFNTDLYTESIKAMESIFHKKYDSSTYSEDTKAFRVIADHLKAAVFIVADGVVPANKEQGYVLRRAIRRAVKFAYLAFHIKPVSFTKPVIDAVLETYKDAYPHLKGQQDLIVEIIGKEEDKFWKMFVNGIDIARKDIKKNEELTGEKGFYYYESYGFPRELTTEYWRDNHKKISSHFDAEFDSAEKAHKQNSRQGAEKRFKGGLADTKEVTVRYHTAAHLMLAALQKVLGTDVHQKGQNITDERVRFDINFARPVTAEEIKKVEDLVNEAAEKNLIVTIEQMKKTEFKDRGVEGSFMDRYGDMVNVYKMSDPKTGTVYSYEVCGGPHVTHTSELLESGKFKIIKEESSGQGVRRIKAVFVK